MESGGVTREYRLHVPASYAAGTAVPLVLNLHGFASNALEQEILSGTSAKADAEGFLVVYPQALGSPPTWRVGTLAGGDEDLAFIEDLLQALEGQYTIDPRRVYATGISNGGGMVHRIGCDLANRVAAIAPVSGAYLESSACSPARPMPVVAFHGTADRIVPYDGQGVVLPPVRDWAAAWAGRDACAAGPEVVFRNGEVTGEAWTDCAGGSEVILYTIEGRGHSWPGADLLPGLAIATRDIVATDAMWDFFVRHPGIVTGG